MGEKQVLLVGLGTEAQKVQKALEETEIQVICRDGAKLHLTVGEAFGESDGLGGETLSPAMIMLRSFTRDELDEVLRLIRQAGLSRQPLKAMVTPTNWSWRLEALYEELQEEQKIMSALIRLKQLRDSMPLPDFMDIPAMQARMQAEMVLKGGENATMESIQKAYDALLKFQK